MLLFVFGYIVCTLCERRLHFRTFLGCRESRISLSERSGFVVCSGRRAISVGVSAACGFSCGCAVRACSRDRRDADHGNERKIKQGLFRCAAPTDHCASTPCSLALHHSRATEHMRYPQTQSSHVRGSSMGRTLPLPETLHRAVGPLPTVSPFHFVDSLSTGRVS